MKRGLALAVCAVTIVACGESPSQAPPSPSVRASPAAVVYPPTTIAQARHFAQAEGNAAAVHEFHSESVGLSICPQPKRSVTLDASLPARTVQADLLAYFYDQQLDNDCGALVLAYRDPSEYGSPFTVGRVALDVAGSKHTLEVDAGNDLAGSVATFTLTY